MVRVRLKVSHLMLAFVAIATGCGHRDFNQNKPELRLPSEPPLALTRSGTPGSNVVNSTSEEVLTLSKSGAIDKETRLHEIPLPGEGGVVVLDDDLREEAEPENVDEVTLQEDSEKSPEELAEIVTVPTLKIEGDFPLCEGSIYLSEWEKSFDRKWHAENANKYKKRSKMRSAFQAARSEAFMTLLFPALETLNYDYPVVISDDVLKWINYFQSRGRSVFVTWLRRAQDVAPLIREVLEEYGLPKDLLYLAMVESGFNNRAMSVARAAGPWQFMRATGRLYGLRISDYVDERRDPEKATRAAAEYLTTLYSIFGDWHLASASYNAGEGRVLRAMRGEEQTDFFSLSEAGRLPNETRNYVPKIIAAMIIAKNPQKFGFDVADGSRAIKYKKLAVNRSIVLADLAKATDVDTKVLENLNPELRLGITPPPKEGETYKVRVPESHYALAEKSLASLPNAPLFRRVVTRAPRKERASNLARRFGLSLDEFLKANPRLKASTNLKKGQVISIPVRLGSGQFEKVSADFEPSKRKKKRRTRRTRTAYERVIHKR